jgi:hypothetical protein
MNHIGTEAGGIIDDVTEAGKGPLYIGIEE